MKMWQIWYSAAASIRTKLLAFYPFETQEEEKEERKREGREIHYIFYAQTENFILPEFPGTIRLETRQKTGKVRRRRWKVDCVENTAEEKHEHLLCSARILIRALARLCCG
jgi:hypothetical protein